MATVVGTLYLLAGLVVVAHAVLQLDLLRAARRARGAHDTLGRSGPTSGEPPAALPLPDPAPMVVVQLPVYNEAAVVERLLDAVARQRYPVGRWRIQLIDDSTDATTDLVDRWLAARSGSKEAEPRDTDADTGRPPVHHLRRGTRDGYKAGALAAGLAAAPDADMIAVIDADFVPSQDFLERAVARFTDPAIAAVQSRWGHLNAETSWLTRAQAAMLDAHFGVEQAGRQALGAFRAFNGSAGVLRTAAIRDAGGWRADTLTEDFDLSLRLQLAGWRVVYDDGLVSPAELVDDASALRTQQHRWMRGVAQGSRIFLPRVLRAPLSARRRLHLIGQVLETATFVGLAAQVVLAPPVALAAAAGALPAAVAANVPLAIGFLALLPVYAHASGRRDRDARHRLARFAQFVLLSMGLTLNNAVAVVAGWTGRRAAFERTPKRGEGATTGEGATMGEGTRAAAPGRTLPTFRPRFAAELALAAIAMGGSIAVIVLEPAAIPFLWPVAGWAIGATAIVLDIIGRPRRAGGLRLTRPERETPRASLGTGTGPSK